MVGRSLHEPISESLFIEIIKARQMRISLHYIQQINNRVNVLSELNQPFQQLHFKEIERV